MKSQMQLAREAIAKIEDMSRDELMDALISCGLANPTLQLETITVFELHFDYSAPKSPKGRPSTINRAKWSHDKNALSLAF